MAQINIHLPFAGQCEEAFKLYEQTLGGKILFMGRYKEMPDQSMTPPGWGDKIMHASMNINGVTIMGADSDRHYSKPQGIDVSVNVNDPAEAERVFAKLSEGGQVRMPLEETFWAKKFGMCTDRYGIPWMINCSKPEQA
jgi:PhnB protein